ncbi:ABC transporter ATP-binding protein, partial [Idiomarina xiamenensis]
MTSKNQTTSAFSPSFRQPLTLLIPCWRRLLLGLLMMLITVVIQLSIPRAIAYFIDHAVRVDDRDWLSWAGWLMVAVLVVHAGATAMRLYLFESAGATMVTALRQRLYQRLLGQSISFYDQHRIGDLSNRLSADVEQLKDTLTMGFAIALRAALTCVGGAVLLLLLSPALSLLMLVIVPLSFYAARFTGKKLRGKSRDVQQQLADCNQLAQESFANIRLIHAFNQQRSAQQRYRQATDDAKQSAIASSRLLASYQGVTTFIQYLVLLVTLWFGGQLVLAQQLSIGELTSFILYAAMVAMSATGVSWFWGEWMKAMGATERVFQLLAQAPAQPLAAPADDQHTPATPISGDIRFHNVSFCYPSRPEVAALTQLNLHIKAGERVALVGASGAGKSTIASLLLGFYQPASGQIYFDDIDAATMPLAQRRQQLAIVEQEPSLFSGTVMDNLRFAVAASDRMSVSDEEIIAAAKRANAHEFIQRLPAGYDTHLGDRGLQLSGGQKQRIAIARAILRDARILILDEATSALDESNENQIQQALNELMAGRTTIIISHRAATIAQAERVVHLRAGQVVPAT